jgi:serine/threonine-protein kinase RsbW
MAFPCGKAEDHANVSKGTPTVRLELQSRPECLTLVRGVLTGIGETLAFDPELLDDLKTAVSEACNNVVLHAYGGQPGPLSVSVRVGHNRVEAAVYDRGSGIQAVAAAEGRMGVGLAVISALAERAEFISAPGEGTSVRMVFSGEVRRAPALAELSEPVSLNGVESPAGLDQSVAVTLTPPSLVAGVLGRLARGLAATAHFSVDRFSDLYLVGDALAEHTRAAAAGDELRFVISPANRRLELTIGPFRKRSSAKLDRDLAVLADELQVNPDGDGEALWVVVVDRRRPG